MKIKKGGIKIFIAAHVQTSSYHAQNLSTQLSVVQTVCRQENFLCRGKMVY
jgi:hypothetical protein